MGSEEDAVEFEDFADAAAFTPDPITVKCPSCGVVDDVPGAWAGLKITCKECGEKRLVERPGGGDPDE